MRVETQATFQVEWVGLSFVLVVCVGVYVVEHRLLKVGLTLGRNLVPTRVPSTRVHFASCFVINAPFCQALTVLEML